MSVTFTAVVVTHANAAGLDSIIRNLSIQTRRPDEIIICHSGYQPAEVASFKPLADIAVLVERPDCRDWGHDKRAFGLECALGDWVGFFNDDDSYDPRYLEIMLAAATDEIDAVYCAWNEQPDCDFALARSTAGNFICRSDLGRKAGYTSRRYEADGDFIEALKAAGARVARVSEVLYHHNVQDGVSVDAAR